MWDLQLFSELVSGVVLKERMDAAEEMVVAGQSCSAVVIDLNSPLIKLPHTGDDKVSDCG